MGQAGPAGQLNAHVSCRPDLAAQLSHLICELLLCGRLGEAQALRLLCRCLQLLPHVDHLQTITSCIRAAFQNHRSIATVQGVCACRQCQAAGGPVHARVDGLLYAWTYTIAHVDGLLNARTCCWSAERSASTEATCPASAELWCSSCAMRVASSPSVALAFARTRLALARLSSRLRDAGQQV